MAYTRTFWVNGEAPYINATNLNNIETGIFNNDAAITVNAANIAANLSKINTNTSNISSNAAAVALNTQDISTNTAQIAQNVSDIAANAAAVANKAEAADLTDHTGNTSNPHGVTAAQVGAEPELSNPSVDGQYLASLADGTRYWATPGGGAADVFWGGIQGTLTSQTDLQNALNLKADITYVDTQDATKMDKESPSFSGTMVGVGANIDISLLWVDDISLEGMFRYGTTGDGGDFFMQSSTNSNANVHTITVDSKELAQTSTDITWGGTPVVVGNASDTNVGGVKVLVSGTDCYITTDGSTPGP